MGSAIFATKLAAAIEPTDENLEDIDPELFIKQSQPTDCYFIYDEEIPLDKGAEQIKITKTNIRKIKLLYRELTKRGFKIIYKPQKMQHIEYRKLQITNAATVMVFINKNTLPIINNPKSVDGIELKYSLFKKSHHKLITIILDPLLRDPKIWPG